MSTLQLIYAAVIFVSVTAAAIIVLLPFAPGRAKQRLDAFAANPEFGGAAARRNGLNHCQYGGQVREAVVAFGRMGRLALASALPARRLQGDAPVMIYFGAKTLLAILLPIIAYFYIMLGGTKFGTNAMLSMLLSAGASGTTPNAVLSRLVFIRQREIFETFPDAADLLLVCVEAGLGLDAATSRWRRNAPQERRSPRSSIS